MFSLACKNVSNINKLQKIISSNGIIAMKNYSVVDNTPIDGGDKGNISNCIYLLVWDKSEVRVFCCV